MSSQIKLVSPHAYTVYEQIMDIVDDRVLVVGFSDELQHVFVVLASQVQPDDVEAVIEES